jgi:hypothetical protein
MGAHKLLEITALDPMDGHAAPAGDVALDGIGWRRLAAAPQRSHQLAHADDQDGVTRVTRVALPDDDFGRLGRRIDGSAPRRAIWIERGPTSPRPAAMNRASAP